MGETLSAVVLAAILAACGTSEPSDTGVACRSAGGDCYVGDLVPLCARQGPMDCGSGPAGQFCCITFVDAGDGD